MDLNTHTSLSRTLSGYRPSLPPFFQIGQLNQMTRPMRRLYVGGLPAPCYDFMLTTFLNQVSTGICVHLVDACRWALCVSVEGGSSSSSSSSSSSMPSPLHARH